MYQFTGFLQLVLSDSSMPWPCWLGSTLSIIPDYNCFISIITALWGLRYPSHFRAPGTRLREVNYGARMWSHVYWRQTLCSRLSLRCLFALCSYSLTQASRTMQSTQQAFTKCRMNYGINGSEIEYFILLPQLINSVEQKSGRSIAMFLTKRQLVITTADFIKTQNVLPYRSDLILIATRWAPPMERTLC